MTYDAIARRVYTLKPPTGSYTTRAFDIMTIDDNGKFILNKTIDIS